jgi:hypothetical protein
MPKGLYQTGHITRTNRKITLLKTDEHYANILVVIAAQCDHYGQANLVTNGK